MPQSNLQEPLPTLWQLVSGRFQEYVLQVENYMYSCTGVATCKLPFKTYAA